MIRRPPQTARRLAGGFLLFALLAGCATAPQSQRLTSAPPSGLATGVELHKTPFFPQERFQCGPAALATVLNAGGSTVTPEVLAPQVFLPEREGSLQLELIAATRRHGQVPYVLAPQLEAVLMEVQAGHPVVVLQNLALSWAPRWHYAVVVGYDLREDFIVLRSGTDPRHVIALDRFERTWARGNRWAMVALPPEQLPRTAQPLPYLEAVADFEVLGDYANARRGYATALQRWPDQPAAWMGLGNTLYALGRKGEAEQSFRQLLEHQPEYAPALNNLAQLLAERGALKEAEALAQRAVAADAGVNPVYAQTLAEIQKQGASTRSEEKQGAQ